MQTVPVIGRHAASVALLALFSGSQACEPAGDSGAFIARLGTDTVAVEHYTLAGGRFESVSVSRSPSTVVRRYVATLGDDGSVAAFAADMDGRPLTEQPPAVAGSIPLSGQFWLPWELALRRAVASGRDTITVTMLAGGDALPTLFQRTTPDTWSWPNQFGIGITAHVDASGRLLSADGGGGSTVERVAQLDVATMGAEFARRDSAGQGLGALSPRDTTRAMLGGAALLVDYGRPSLRGRDLAMLAPAGQIWRTGANAATHFQTDRNLVIGDAAVPAGTYTLYTLPAAEGWTLIINRQTGQAGTEYDEMQDLARVPMHTTQSTHTERFTIEIVTEGDGGAIVLRWGSVAASAPVRAAG